MKLFFSSDWIFVVCCMLLTISSKANSTDRNHAQLAETAFSQGKFDEASKEWKELLKAGVSDPDLYYNIGLAELNSGNLPVAMMNFEKARRFKPFDTAINNAIKRGRDRIENPVIPVNPFFLAEWWTRMISVFRPGIWAIIGLGLLFVSLIHWFTILQVIRTRILFLPGKKWVYVVSGIIFILMSQLSYREVYERNEGILFTDCEMNQGPSIQSPELRLLFPGEKVKVVDEISGWYKVNLLNLDEGWVRKECLKIIDLREKPE